MKENTIQRCKATTKKNVRCKNRAIHNNYCWIHSLIYNKLDRVIAIISLVITIALAVYFFIIGPTLENQEKLLINDEEIRLNILSQNLKYYPGRVFIFLALLKENSDNTERAYIFDYGRRDTPNICRVYSYIDSENDLIFELIDDKGEKHSLSVNHKAKGFQFNKKYLWYFEYGNHTFESYLRVFANGKLLGEKTINYGIEIGTLSQYNELTLGASLFGYFPGHFDCWANAVSKVSFNAEEKRGILNIFYAKKFNSLFGVKVPKWASFDGTFYYFSAIGADRFVTMKPKVN